MVRTLRIVWSRIVGLVRRRRRDAGLDEEIHTHLDLLATEYMRRGLSADEARDAARREFGGVEQVKEQWRDTARMRWVEELADDVRYAVRTLLRRPGFSVVALLTIGLGCGATTVMFTVLNAVVLEPLPYPHADTLLNVFERTKAIVDYRFGDRWAFSYPNFVDCRCQAASLELAAFRNAGGILTGSGDAEYVDGLQISFELMPMLGVVPAIGRLFTSTDDQPGASPVMVVSHSLWQRRFGGTAAVLNTTVRFDGLPYTIVGVAPATFNLRGADVFTPIAQNTSRIMSRRDTHPGIAVWARVRPGRSSATAQAELDALGRNLAAAYPQSNEGREFVIEPLRANVGEARPTLWLLFGAVCLLLAIACVNVASLLLARAVSRDREVAVRAALGASRGRLARHYLTESTVLSVCGGALGVAIAAVATRPFIAFWPGILPRSSEVQLNVRVLAFAVVVSLVCGSVFGVAPVIRAAAQRLEDALRAGGRAVRGANRLHASFVVAEIALAMVLVGSAGVLASTLMKLSSVDPGVDIHNVLTSRMALSPTVLAVPARARAAWDDTLERAQRVPGVRAVALVDTVPMRNGNNQLGFWTAPPEPPRMQKPLALATSVTPQYFEVMGIPLIRGRLFDERDRANSQHVVVIDEVMARHAFRGDDPLGKVLWTDLVPEPLTVIGVVGHVRHWGLAGDDEAVVRDQFYYPFAQIPDQYVRRWSELMSLVVRSDTDPLAGVSALRHELRGAAGDQVLYETQTLERLARDTLARHRFLLVLFALFAGIALALACVGLYGMLAYVTSQRVREFGVRVALGATARDVLTLVVRQSVRIVAVGAVIGASGAWIAGRVLQRLVVGMRGLDPLTLLVLAVILITPALVATVVPARRAARVDPIAALRQD